MSSIEARRVARLRAVLADRQLDGLLITDLANVRYLTGFSGSSGWLVLTSGHGLFGTDGRYEEQAAEQLVDDIGLVQAVFRDGIVAGMAERLGREFKAGRFGFEAERLSFSVWRKLAEETSVDWQPTSGLVEELRQVKGEAEIEALQKAAEIAAQALRETLPMVSRGVRELEVAAELDYRMRRLGSEGSAFETTVASGPRTALPHAGTSRRPIEDGDLLLIDFGARWQGYCSDLTRTFVMGAATPRQLEVYALVLAAQEAACRVLAEGAAASDVDGAARSTFEAAGVGDRYIHSTGHGLGLEVHERPRLSSRSEDVLSASAVVTVEPGLYFPGWGGIRIEDDVVVTDGQPRILVNLEKEHLTALPADTS